jgi:hypothetical protein
MKSKFYFIYPVCEEKCEGKRCTCNVSRPVLGSGLGIGLGIGFRLGFSV